ncbi:ret finger protein-like 4B [Ochotona princeps]|uniref:ret finger protein-like 4B n=1 Tax=Ochotona princeps TaxID=9978 RepID=UPI002714EC30|nr:ret finger protein-like 4B [Ochotona princeps]XP_058525256.1 ret finger protein-like 4B [Ochotona princeps]
MSEDRGIECPTCKAVSQRAPLREVQLEQISLCLKQHWGLIKTELLISDEMRSMWEDVRLDPGTAHSLLLLSSDLKSVRYGTMCHNTEPDACRVTQLVSVLGSPSFSRGCHYWEVEVGEGHEWALGVCRDSVDRQCKGDVSCEQGFWIISKQAGEIRAHSLQPRILRASPGLHRVGIFVNVELEVVKFFDAANNSYLYMYKSVPSCEPLRPFFSPGPPREGATAVPLRICQ